MLVEFIIMLEVFGLVIAGFAFIKRNPFLWALAAVIFGGLSLMSFDIQYRDNLPTTQISVVDGNTTTITYAYGNVITTDQSTALFAINIGFFSVILVFLFFDIYGELHKDN